MKYRKLSKVDENISILDIEAGSIGMAGEREIIGL